MPPFVKGAEQADKVEGEGQDAVLEEVQAAARATACVRRKTDSVNSKLRPS